MADWGTRGLERRAGDWARARLPGGLAEFVMFLLKQGWAALFGILFCIAILGSKAIWQPDWALSRYDGLFLFAILTQAFMLIFRLETWEEAKVILLFHVTGTAMELFKTSVGSWTYPEHSVFFLGNVPLFSGFMYAAIGSYIARVIRIFEMRFAPYPPFWLSVVFGVAAYVNFFSHHFVPDIRLALFIGSVLIFGRTRVWFFIGRRARWMPMPLAAFLCAYVVWVAEDIGTMTGTWIYAGQSPLEMVSFSKMGSWYLLLFVAFVTVTLISRRALSREAGRPPDRDEIAVRGLSPRAATMLD